MKVILLWHVINNTHKLKNLLMRMWDSRCELIIKFKSYLQEIGINNGDLEEIWNINFIRKLININVENDWINYVNNKVSLRYYKEINTKWDSTQKYQIFTDKYIRLFDSGCVDIKINITENLKWCDICQNQNSVEHILNEYVKFDEIKLKLKLQNEVIGNIFKKALTSNEIKTHVPLYI